MDAYHVWCNLAEGVSDVEFADDVGRYLDHLVAEGRLARWRLTRRKLGLGPPSLPEFHLVLDFDDLAQLDRAFLHVAGRAGPVEGFHRAVNAKARDVLFALYRDFPDPVRERGGERF